jgi:hypothetical protein
VRSLQAVLAILTQKARSWERLETYLDLWHHVYQDNYYNIVQIAENLLLRKTRFCGKIRANRGIPKSLADFSEKVKWTILSVSGKGTFFCASGRIRGRFV